MVKYAPPVLTLAFALGLNLQNMFAADGRGLNLLAVAGSILIWGAAVAAAVVYRYTGVVQLTQLGVVALGSALASGQSAAPIRIIFGAVAVAQAILFATSIRSAARRSNG